MTAASASRDVTSAVSTASTVTSCMWRRAVCYIWISILFLMLRWPASWYKGADKSLARTTSRCILFDGENISFDASLGIYI